MRDIRILAALALAITPSKIGAQGKPPSPAALAVVSRAEQEARGRGYVIPREPSAVVPALAVKPAGTVPYGALVSEGMQHSRSCTEAQATTHHPCIRVDALVLYAVDSSVGDHVIVGVLARTFVGDSVNDATEIDPSADVLADAGVFARRYGGRVVQVGRDPGPSAPGDPSAVGSTQPSSSEALGRAQIEAARQGYRMGRGPVQQLRAFAALGPSPAVTGMEGIGLMAVERECTPSESATHRPCLKIDWLEIFFGPEPGKTSEQVGVIPHTAVGTKAQDLTEVEADSAVVNAAAAVAQKSGGRVVHAIPWQIPLNPSTRH